MNVPPLEYSEQNLTSDWLNRRPEVKLLWVQIQRHHPNHLPFLYVSAEAAQLCLDFCLALTS